MVLLHECERDIQSDVGREEKNVKDEEVKGKREWEMKEVK